MYPGGLLATMFASGLLGSVGHCLGMCGPLNMVVATEMRRNDLPVLRTSILYHGARIGVYAFLGAVIGGLGSLFGLSRHLTSLGGGVSLVLGVGLLVLGAGYLGVLRVRPFDRAARWWNRALRAAMGQGGRRGVAALGAVNGLLPCGLVYAALLLAASTGRVWVGALGMIAFGLGTTPALLAVDVGASVLGVRVRRVMTVAAGGVMVFAGLQLLLRGGAALRIWPHVHWGPVALW